jgi:hypothetical protein
MFVLGHIGGPLVKACVGGQIDDSRGRVTPPWWCYVVASARSRSWARRNPIRFGLA